MHRTVTRVTLYLSVIKTHRIFQIHHLRQLISFTPESDSSNTCDARNIVSQSEQDTVVIYKYTITSLSLSLNHGVDLLDRRSPAVGAPSRSRDADERDRQRPRRLKIVGQLGPILPESGQQLAPMVL